MPPHQSRKRDPDESAAISRRHATQSTPQPQPTPQQGLKTPPPSSGFANTVFPLYNAINSPYLLYFMIIFDILFTIAIVWKVPYTEIDWIAYMQEVTGFVNGELNYLNLKGDTGPLVYPAGFLYIYSLLYYVTNSGKTIFIAQCIFALIYLITIALCSYILYKSNLVPTILIPMIHISKRLHSIYMLRCFNDTVAMLCVYIAVVFLLKNRYYWCSTFMSVGLSVKMNVLLFFPGLAMIYLMKYHRQIGHLLQHALLIIAVQFVLGFPFLMTYPKEYLEKAFEFSRVFTYIWTVNWKCISEDIFLNPIFSKILLALLIATLLSVFIYLDIGRLKESWIGPKPTTSPPPTPQCIVSHLYLSNFIGILLSRSLHYQFYSWYMPTIPLLLSLAWNIYRAPSQLPTAQQAFPTLLRVALAYMTYFVIEWTWNVYPSNFNSSLTWQIVHWVVFALILSNLPGIANVTTASK